VTNNSAAAQYVRREYRRGWELPAEREVRVARGQSPNGTTSSTDSNQRPARFPLLRRLLRRD
jgi:hypothetical protein